MDFFDNALDKAKEVFNVACKKTTEVVSIEKQKFDIASLENKRAKDFEKLGRLYYKYFRNLDIDNEEISDVIIDIKEKNKKILELKNEINNIKNKRNCPACGASIDKNSVFCNSCGMKLEYGSEENE